MGIKFFNKFPSHQKELFESSKIFKSTLKNSFHCFYKLEESYGVNS
jgi:hypothetical protein